MALKKLGGTLHTQRFTTKLDNSWLTKKAPEKTLSEILPKKSGRGVDGRVTTRHQGGREKRFYRVIDWKRDKHNIAAKVVAVEYDPNRTANIALLVYTDGEKRYILHPEGLNIGSQIISAENAEAIVGNALPLWRVPIGSLVHNIETSPGAGGKLVRSAGAAAVLTARDDKQATLKMPSGEFRMVSAMSWATIGQIGNLDWRHVVIGKAGRSRHLGIRPTVRGTAQHPGSHPHGGGEGRSGEGMPPKTPWGKIARGGKTRKNKKYSDKFIIKRRK